MDFKLSQRYVVISEPRSGKRAVVGVRDRIWKAVKLADRHARTHTDDGVSVFEIRLDTPIYSARKPVRKGML